MGAKRIVKRILWLADPFIAPLVFLAGILLKAVRAAGVHRMTASRRALEAVGVFPVRDHYYEPLFRTRPLRPALAVPRDLPGLAFDDARQLELLGRFNCQQELRGFPLDAADAAPGGFYYHNDAFESGDAECLYSMIRHFRPRTLVEVGGGFSTRLAHAAVLRNQADDPAYRCRHVCVEPYEHPWLETLGIEVLRARVEEAPRAVFAVLRAGDMLFIDSSHVIRPLGDVLVECLQILPSLPAGVLVHLHDIFTPWDYPAEWICDEVRLWNEQYLVEALLCENPRWRILLALHDLSRRYPERLAERFPVYALEREHRQPGSLWLERL